MSSSRVRYNQLEAKSVVAFAESNSRGLTSTPILYIPSSLNLTSFNSSTRLVTLTTGHPDIPNNIAPGGLIRFFGTTPANNNYYTIQTVINATQITTVETPPSSLTGGTVNFYYPSGATITGVDNTGYVSLSGVSNAQSAFNILDDRAIRIYTSSGLRTDLKIWTGRQQSTGTATLTFDISSAGFTSILSVSATAERNTSTLGDVSLANIRSASTTSVVVQLVESTGILIGGQGLEYSTSTSNFVNLLVIGL